MPPASGPPTAFLPGAVPLASFRTEGLLKTALFICLAILLGAPLAWGQAPDTQLPGWWDQAAKQAASDGYRLIAPPELQKLMGDSDDDLVVLDVRPGYEAKAGHIPGALNLEFHLGDRLRLTPAKEKALTELLGEDMHRPVVIYCRSYS